MSLDTTIVFSEEKKLLGIKPKGELDIFSSAEFKKQVVKDMDRHGFVDVEIDCAELTYVDSTGLGVLMFFVKEIESKDGKLKMINLKKNIAKLLLITKMDKFIELEGQLDG
ncbi:MAG: STAS domain-containing protein [Tissierellia bacterium]|nr:STAS domain-containing protein [Tissierellia bacterium]